MQFVDVKWNNLRPVLAYIESHCRKDQHYFVFSLSVTSYAPLLTKMLVPILFHHCMCFSTNIIVANQSVATQKLIRTGYHTM